VLRFRRHYLASGGDGQGEAFARQWRDQQAEFDANKAKALV
jgi:hypothetical protein